MNAFKAASFRQIRQVAADRLKRYAEVGRQTFDCYLSVSSCDVEDFGMAKSLGHLVSFTTKLGNKPTCSNLLDTPKKATKFFRFSKIPREKLRGLAKFHPKRPETKNIEKQFLQKNENRS